MKALSKNRGKVRINHDYFNLNSRIENVANFLKAGHWFAHAIDRFKWHYGPKWSIVFPFPSHIDIETSNRCQMKCPMCGRGLMKDQKQGDMDFALFTKIIDECSRERVYSVKLSWRGEPLLNSKIVEMVAYAKKKGIKDVAFLTNGERLNKDLVDRLIDAGLDWISISVDGLGEIYERIRFPAKFDSVVSSITHIREAREKRGQKKPIIRVQSIWSAIKHDPQQYQEFWKPIADKVCFIADQIRSSDQKDFKHDPSYICQSAWQRICVMWDGRIAQCHNDYLEKNILGDVRVSSLREIWHNQRSREFRRLMREKKRLQLKPCQTCCDGGITKEETIQVGDRTMKINLYVDQNLEVEKMDARPGVKK